MYHKKIYIYKYENTTAGHVYREKKKTKEKTILEERGPCVSNQCYEAACLRGVLRPASLYKYEKTN